MNVIPGKPEHYPSFDSVSEDLTFTLEFHTTNPRVLFSPNFVEIKKSLYEIPISFTRVSIYLHSPVIFLDLLPFHLS